MDYEQYVRITTGSKKSTITTNEDYERKYVDNFFSLINKILNNLKDYNYSVKVSETPAVREYLIRSTDDMEYWLNDQYNYYLSYYTKVTNHDARCEEMQRLIDLFKSKGIRNVVVAADSSFLKKPKKNKNKNKKTRRGFIPPKDDVIDDGFRIPQGYINPLDYKVKIVPPITAKKKAIGEDKFRAGLIEQMRGINGDQNGVPVYPEVRYEDHPGVDAHMWTFRTNTDAVPVPPLEPNDFFDQG